MYSYTDEHYQRGTIHKNMGSQKYYGVHALEIPYTNDYGEWTSDEEFFSKLLEIIDEYDEDTKFMTWLTTVSTNQPYSTSSKYGDLYLDLFKNTNYSDATKRYLSKLKVLDNAIGILIDGLKTRNILDDTVIILYSDNYPYGLAKTDIEKILGNIYADGLVDKTPFVIYNPSLEAKEYNQYTTYMNLTPTVANLFNLDYDPRLYLGEDILSDDYQGIVVFADGSWKNEHVYFDAATSNIKYYDDFYNIDDIKKISTDVFMRMKVSALAIKNNYFNYLNKTFIRNKEEDSDTGIKIEVDTESSNQTNESVETNLEKVEQNE